MICPQCKKTLKEDKELSKPNKKVYKFFVIGQDVSSGDKYCPQCVSKHKTKK